MDDFLGLRGVSVEYLQQIFSDLVDNKLAAGLQLHYIVQDHLDKDGPLGKLKKGDTIRVVKRKGDLWYGYRANGKEGWFPKEVVEFESKSRSAWTVKELVYFGLKPALTTEVTKYTDTVPEEHKSPVDYHGAFVATSWNIHFAKLVDMLLSHYKEEDPSESFVWLDAFGLNHAIADAQDGKELWDKYYVLEVKKAVQEFDEFLFCLDSPKNPKILKDKSSLWTLYHYTSTDNGVDDVEEFVKTPQLQPKILINNDDLEEFLQDAIHSNDHHIPGLGGVDVEKHHGQSKNDKLVTTYIKTEVGVDEFNDHILHILRAWAYSVVHHETTKEEKTAETVQLLLAALKTRLAYELGASVGAVECFEELIEHANMIKEQEDQNLMQELKQASLQMASFWQKVGKVEFAAKILENTVKMPGDEVGTFEDAMTWVELAIVFHDQERYDEAEELLKHILEAFNMYKDKVEPKDLALVYHVLASAYFNKENTEEGEKAMVQSLEILKNKYGEKKGHPDIVLAMFNLALLRLKHVKDSLDNVRLGIVAALKMRKAVRIDRTELASVVHELADVFGSLNLFADADQMYTAALSMYRKKQKGHHPMMAVILLSKGKALFRLNKLSDAEAIVRASLEFLEKQDNGKDSNIRVKAMTTLADVLEAIENYEPALDLYRKSLDMKKRLEYQDGSIAVSLNNLAILETRLGHLEKAEELYASSLELVKALQGSEDDGRVASITNNLAGVLFTQNKIKEAEELYRNALEMRKRMSNGVASAEVIESYSALGNLLKSQEQYDEACELFRLGLVMSVDLYQDKKHPNVKLVQEQLEGCQLLRRQRDFNVV